MGKRLMVARLPARLRVIRHLLTKLQQLTAAERASITKGQQGGLPSLIGRRCMRCRFTSNGPLKAFERRSTPQISHAGSDFVPMIRKRLWLDSEITLTRYLTPTADWWWDAPRDGAVDRKNLNRRGRLCCGHGKWRIQTVRVTEQQSNCGIGSLSNLMFGSTLDSVWADDGYKTVVDKTPTVCRQCCQLSIFVAIFTNFFRPL